MAKRPIREYEPIFDEDENGEFYIIAVPYKNEFVSVMLDLGDYEEFAKYNWSVLMVRGTHKYVQKCVVGKRGKKLLLHRMLMGVKEGLEIDHIDGNGFNCRRYNMRIATRLQNSRNRIKRTKGTSIFKGVSWNAKDERWIASIRVNGLGKYLGSFVKEIIDDIDEGEKRAARAYDEAAIKYFGVFALLNMPEERNMVTTLMGENLRQSYLLSEDENKKVEYKIRELQKYKPTEIYEIMKVMSLTSLINMCHYYGCGIEELIKEIRKGVKAKSA